MRRFVLVFLAVVADLVKDFSDPVWQMVLHLTTVYSLVCATAFFMGKVAELSVMATKNKLNIYPNLRV